MRTSPPIAWLAAALLAGAACANPKETPAPWRSELLARMKSDRELAKLLYLCPADVAGRNVASRRDTPADPEEACQRDPAACFDWCKAGNAEACMNLAFALDVDKPAGSSNARKALYAAACALGDPGGCTNRASELRNSDDFDPLDHAAEPAKNCEARTFRYACEHDDAWGCAMLGQALLNGEGAPADARQARAYFDKSCNIDAEFEACKFAKKLESSGR